MACRPFTAVAGTTIAVITILQGVPTMVIVPMEEHVLALMAATQITVVAAQPGIASPLHLSKMSAVRCSAVAAVPAEEAVHHRAIAVTQVAEDVVLEGVNN